MATTSAAFAGGGFDIVIPGRPGVPIIINGIDASYAAVEANGVSARQPGSRPFMVAATSIRIRVSAITIRAQAGFRLRAAGDRTSGGPPIAAAGRKLSPIMVFAVCSAAGAVERPRRSAGGDLRAGDWASRTAEFSTLKPSHRKTLTGEINASNDFRLVAAVAVMAAAPAMACGYTGCAQPVYVAPVYVAPVASYGYSGCNPCGGWHHERLADPVDQYGYYGKVAAVLLCQPGPDLHRSRSLGSASGLSGRFGRRLWLRLWHGYRHHRWHSRVSYYPSPRHHGYPLRRYY